MTPCFESFSKEARFKDLVQSVKHCDLCTRLSQRTRVLSEANGNLNAKVLFVAEAPGRLGADRTGIPLYGDQTGKNFEMLLGNIGWKREQVFITNAVLCNPRKQDGNNGTPTAEEIANCSAYLGMLIFLVRPDVVVSLGATALKALELISPHGLGLRERVARLTGWFGMQLFPLYHPGPRATVRRSLVKQRADFIRLSKLVHPETGLKMPKSLGSRKKRVDSKIDSPLHQVARAFLELGRRMTHFKLMKLLYLFDLRALERLGHTYACHTYLRQEDGPWAPALRDALESMDGFEVQRAFSRRIPIVKVGLRPRSDIQIPDNVLEIVAEVYEKFGTLSNSRIKTAAYLTKPMKFILGKEKEGKNMTNKPVIHKDKTAAQLAES